MNLKEYIYLYLIFINLASFICFFIDKKRAKRKMWRISEAFLLGISILGGAFGSILGMKIFHHKNRKKKFSLGLPLIWILNIFLLYYILNFNIR